MAGKHGKSPMYVLSTLALAVILVAAGACVADLFRWSGRFRSDNGRSND